MKKIVSFALVVFMLLTFVACGSGSDPKTYTFTLMFLADGNIVQRANYSVGDTISAPVTVEKEGYTFTGWAEEVPVKMPARDLYINAVFEKNSYKVSYYINDILVHEDTVPFNDRIPEYKLPKDTAESFSGWDGELPETMPAHDIALHGNAKEETYTLTYKVNGAVYRADVYKKGEKIVLPDEPKMEGYSFVRWSGYAGFDFKTMPGQNVTVDAEFAKQEYKLNYFESEGGKLLETVGVEFGAELHNDQSVVAPTAPEGKIFAGWSGMPETMPAHDVSVYPVWEDAPVKYTVSFIIKGVVYTTMQLEAGERIVPPVFPTDSDIRWVDVPETMPAHDITIYAETSFSYLIEFYTDEDTVYMSFLLTEGSDISLFLPKDPHKDGYKFVGWDGLVDKMPEHALKLMAIWEKTAYTLSFYDADPQNGGKLISQSSVAGGDPVVYPDAPAKEGLTFVSWSENAAVMPESDLTVYAVWEADKFTLTYFSSLDGQVSVEFGFGEEIIPLVPEEHYGYKFGGWMGIPETMPAHDVTVVAIWTEVVPDPVNVMVDLSTLGDGETYTIIAGGTYTLAGIANNAKIVIDSKYDVTLKLKNTYLTCKEGNAIECVAAASLTIQALPGSVSLISTKDGGIVSAADLGVTGNGNVTFATKTGIRSEGNIVFDANNSYLTITSDDLGISAGGDIFIASGRLDIESAGESLVCAGSIKMDGGEVIAESSAAGCVSAGGTVSVGGGKLMIKAAGDGVAAAGYTQTGGTTEITSGGSGIVSAGHVSFSDSDVTVYSDSVAVRAAADFNSVNSKFYTISGGSAVMPPVYDANGVRIETTSVIAGSATVNGGTVEITSTQYAFMTESFKAKNAVLKLTTSEDAIYVTGDADFSDCTLQIHSGLSFKNDASALTRGGVRADGGVTFIGGTVEISSVHNCVTAKTLSAMGTEFRADSSKDVFAVTEKAFFGACVIEVESSDNCVVAGTVEFKSTNANMTADTNGVRATAGLMQQSGGEIKICSAAPAISVTGTVELNGGILVAFSKSTSLPSIACSRLNVVSGTLAAFDMSDNNYMGNGFYCNLGSTVKEGNLFRLEAVGGYDLTLYLAYSCRSILIVTDEIASGTVCTVHTGGRYSASDTYTILTGGTYIPGTLVYTGTYK